MKKLLLSFVMIFATTFIKDAAADTFTGGYLGGQAGLTASNTKVSVTNEKAMNVANSAGATRNTNKDSKGLVYGAFGGYGRTLNDTFYVGGEVSIFSDTSNRKVNQNATDSGNNASYKNNVNYKRGIAVGVAPRLGYVFGNNIVYAKPGVEVSKDKATAVVAVTPVGGSTQNTVVSASKRNIVIVPAVGYEKALGSLLLRTEYIYNRGKKLGLNSNGTPITELGNVSYKDHRFAVGAAYKF